ncbi:eukaryotic membrane protein family-domain-containing protein [Hyaloraphidium curvatum]|nr:eukaryotic membrane protein family-domain-containing protein [Hyaloraphidium curvatum]
MSAEGSSALERLASGVGEEIAFRPDAASPEANDALHSDSEYNFSPSSETSRRYPDDPLSEDDLLSSGDASGEDSPRPKSFSEQDDARRKTRSSFLDDLLDEVVGDDGPMPSGQGLEENVERINSFFRVPGEVERIVIFGYLVLLDAFLYIFTILPLRVVLSSYRTLSRMFRLSSVPRLLPQQRSDLVKVAIILIVSMLLREIDTSVVYHGVRGQSVVKLYVIFNVLEILDKLCCSFGNDILDSLYLTRTESRNAPLAMLTFWLRFAVATVYVWLHALVLFYQCTTLQVAINSFNNALLTLLLSNQFVEVKGSVFKKYEKDNLFQLTCADIVERFQLSVFLVIVGIRNYLELSGAGDVLDSDGEGAGHLELSIPLLLKVLAPIGLIFASEILVDWLKHAFVVKFNSHMRTEEWEPRRLYRSFADKFALDIDEDKGPTRSRGGGHTENGDAQTRHAYDHGPALAKRIGFSVLPISCLAIRVCMQIGEFLGFSEGLGSGPAIYLGRVVWLVKVVGGLAVLWTLLVVAKLQLARRLLDYSRQRVRTMGENGAAAEAVRFPGPYVFPAPFRKGIVEKGHR